MDTDKVSAFIREYIFMSVTKRSEIRAGARVQIVEKQNQRTGVLTEGIVQRILTSSANHPRGIKVMLQNGKVGRVQTILDRGMENPRGAKGSAA